MESLQFRQGFLNIRWILFIADHHQVGKNDGSHSFNNDRCAEGKADIVTARDFECIHLTGYEVEGLLRLADA